MKKVKLIEVSSLIPEAKRIITEELGSKFIEAEYEADQKLAQLSLLNEVDLIITEDTDLIVYGNKNYLIYKRM